MNHSETDIDLVEKYFDSALNDVERNHFTARLQTDDNFKTLVEQERALISAIRYQGLQEDLNYLKSVEATLNDSRQVSINRPVRRWYYLAAAAVAAISIITYLFYAPKDTPEELFQAYYKPYPNLFEPTVRGAAAGTNTRTEAFQAYERGDYQQAATLFRELLKTKKEPGILLLLGNANLILGNVDEAKENFITLNKDFDELDIQSKWFLSLCYLKSGDMEHARPMLKELGDTEISYATKARELLNKVH